MSATDHYYLHEKPAIAYRVEVSPRATSSTVEVHRRSATGEVVHRDEKLALEGSGEIVLDLVALKVSLEDSPLFLEFAFTREEGGKTIVKKSVQVIALAEPVVSSIFVPPEGYPGEPVTLEVLDWDVRAYDEPDAPTQFEEREPDRIAPETRAAVRWLVDGKEAPERGDSVKAKLAPEHLGRMIVVEGRVGEAKPESRALRVVVPRVSSRLQRSRLQRTVPEPARGEIAVPSLRIQGPTTLALGETISLEALLEPPIMGTFAWTYEGPEGRIETTELGGTASIRGLARSETPRDILARCTFTSEALRTYRGEVALTVT
jgi:hypothetical protein